MTDTRANNAFSNTATSANGVAGPVSNGGMTATNGALDDALDANAANIMVMQIEGMMTSDVAMVSDKAIESIVRDWGFVESVELVADRASFARIDTRYGPAMTMRATLEIVFIDRSTFERTVIVTASIEDGVFGFHDVSLAA